MGEMRRLYYQIKERKPFKRYMWRWDGIWSGNVFQMSRITVGNIERPYTYINAYCSQGSNASNAQLPENMVKSDSLLSTYDKWCRVSINTSAYGWIIFDIGSSEIVDSYTLMTGDDTGSNTGRNPKRVRLYGTNVDTTSGDDDSWELLSDQNVGLPAANHANWTTSTKEFITSTRYLLAPTGISRGSGLRFEMPDYELVYLSYMTQLSGQNDVPLVNKIGGVWNFNSRRTGTSNISISGAMPNTYSGQKYASFGGAGVTGILPVTTLRKFTICGWMRSNTSGAGEFWGVRYHTAFSWMIFYLVDATKYLNFNFGLTTSNYTVYELTGASNTGGDCPTSIATKSGWAYVCLYIDRDENRAEYWVNNHHMFDISGKADLFNGNQNFDTILRFYPDGNYSGFYLCELAIWSGQRKTDVPTEPLSNIYGS